MGFLVAWLVQFAGTTAILTISVPFFNIVFGSCLLFIVMAEDITNDMAAFAIIAKIRRASDRTKLMKRFCDIMETYSLANE